MTGIERHSAVRVVGVLLVGVASVLSLTGCFMIPLLDDRSPFDDPFGASREDVANAVPVVQHALRDVDAQNGLWLYEASSASENCEGACNLHVEVSIAPAGTASDYPDVDTAEEEPLLEVPEQVLRDVLVAVVPAAQDQHVDVRVVTGYGDAGSAAFDIAVDALFGPLPAEGLSTEAFSVTDDYQGDISVHAHTRDADDVLDAMGLG